MEDTIRRNDVIDEISHIIPYRRYHNGEFTLLYSKHEVVKAIKAVPTVEPKQGKWIEARIRHYPGYECSLCHYGVQPWNNTNYCPNCGARMKGADDE